MSCPILITVFLIQDKFLVTDFKREKILIEPASLKEKKGNPFELLLIFLTNFLIWGDKLLEFPFISWILTKFGESGFINYSYLFFVFPYLYMGGWLISRRFLKKDKLRKYISISIVFYASFLFFIIFSDFLAFLLITAANKIASGIMMSQLTERNVNTSKKSKNSALSYEFIRSSSLLASFIFVPLGTFLSLYIPFEFLIIIVVLMSLLSITPMFLTKIKKK